MSRPLPTWCSRDCPACEAERGAFAAKSEFRLGGIPDCEDAAVLVVPKDAQGRDVEVERGGRLDRELHPGDGDGSQEVSVRKRKHPRIDGDGDRHQRDEVLSPRKDLFRRFASWTSVFVELPACARFVDLLRGLPLIVAVVDLTKKG